VDGLDSVPLTLSRNPENTKFKILEKVWGMPSRPSTRARVSGTATPGAPAPGWHNHRAEAAQEAMHEVFARYLDKAETVEQLRLLVKVLCAGLEKTNSYQVYLVTNRHVIQEHALVTNEPLSVRFNLKAEARVQEYDVPLTDSQGNPIWHFNPNPAVDVAVVPINGKLLQDQGARFDYFRSDDGWLSRSKAKELGLSEGDGIFVLGFPMGLVGEPQDYVIVRQGAIARVRDALDNPEISSFLVDCFIFPGNSGGPVILKPEAVTITGQKPAIGKAYLLGIVKEYKSYVDVAVSTQTKRPRITFEENSGLAEVILADYIDETIQDYKAQRH
jgi:Trypsin-like peptidase domain